MRKYPPPLQGSRRPNTSATVGFQRRVCHSVVGVKSYREDRRVVSDAVLLEDVERPAGLFYNRERRSTKADDILLDAAASDGVKRTDQVAFEVIGRRLRDQQVIITVDGDLVAAVRDFSDQFGQPFGDVTQHEERRADSVFIQQIQHAPGALSHAQVTVVPVLTLDGMAEVVDTEPVFKIN